MERIRQDTTNGDYCVGVLTECTYNFLNAIDVYYNVVISHDDDIRGRNLLLRKCNVERFFNDPTLVGMIDDECATYLSRPPAYLHANVVVGR